MSIEFLHVIANAWAKTPGATRHPGPGGGALRVLAAAGLAAALSGCAVSPTPRGSLAGAPNPAPAQGRVAPAHPVRSAPWTAQVAVAPADPPQVLGDCQPTTHGSPIRSAEELVRDAQNGPCAR